MQIYLPEHFPAAAPMMYVRPVQGMFIKSNHPTVGSEAVSTLPCIPCLHRVEVGVESVAKLIVPLERLSTAQAAC